MRGEIEFYYIHESYIFIDLKKKINNVIIYNILDYNNIISYTSHHRIVGINV